MPRANLDTAESLIARGTLVLGALLWLLVTGAFFLSRGHDLVSGWSILSIGGFVVQSSIAVRSRRLMASPFVSLLLAFEALLIWSRLVTLQIRGAGDYSGVLNRLVPTTSADVDFAVGFLLLCNAAFFLGVASAPRIPGQPQLRCGIGSAGSLVLSALLVAATALHGLNSISQRESRLVSLVSHVVSPAVIIPCAMVAILGYLSSPAERGARRFLIGATTLACIAELLISLLVGNRSILVSMSVAAICACLASRVPRAVATRVIAALGVALLVSVMMFPFTTLLRADARDGGAIAAPVGIERLFGRVGDADHLISPAQFNRVFDRLGYLDFLVDAMKNHDRYGPVAGWSATMKSAVDVLSPGFDVFDQPKTANAISYVYYESNEVPSRLNQSWYQSDPFTCFGSYFLVFGPVLSLAAMGVSGYLFSRAWRCGARAGSYSATLWRLGVLLSFVGWLYGFGLDWFLEDAAKIALMIGFVALMVGGRRNRAAQPAKGGSGTVGVGKWASVH